MARKRINRFPQVRALVFAGSGSISVPHVALVPRRVRQGHRVVKVADKVNMTWHIPAEVRARCAVIDRAKGQRELDLSQPVEKRQDLPTPPKVRKQKVSNLGRCRAYVASRPGISSRELRDWAEGELGVGSHSARGIWSVLKKEGLVG